MKVSEVTICVEVSEAGVCRSVKHCMKASEAREYKKHLRHMWKHLRNPCETYEEAPAVSLVSLLVTWRRRRWNVGDVGMVLEPGRVVVDVSHCHLHSGRAGERVRGASVAAHHNQRVVLVALPVQQGTGDELARGWVYREL